MVTRVAVQSTPREVTYLQLGSPSICMCVAVWLCDRARAYACVWLCDRVRAYACVWLCDRVRAYACVRLCGCVTGCVHIQTNGLSYIHTYYLHPPIPINP